MSIRQHRSFAKTCLVKESSARGKSHLDVPRQEKFKPKSISIRSELICNVEKKREFDILISLVRYVEVFFYNHCEYAIIKSQCVLPGLFQKLSCYIYKFSYMYCSYGHYMYGLGSEI